MFSDLDHHYTMFNVINSTPAKACMATHIDFTFLIKPDFLATTSL